MANSVESLYSGNYWGSLKKKYPHFKDRFVYFSIVTVAVTIEKRRYPHFQGLFYRVPLYVLVITWVHVPHVWLLAW